MTGASEGLKKTVEFLGNLEQAIHGLYSLKHPFITAVYNIYTHSASYQGNSFTTTTSDYSIVKERQDVRLTISDILDIYLHPQYQRQTVVVGKSWGGLRKRTAQVKTKEMERLQIIPLNILRRKYNEDKMKNKHNPGNTVPIIVQNYLRDDQTSKLENIFTPEELYQKMVQFGMLSIPTLKSDLERTLTVIYHLSDKLPQILTDLKQI